MIIPITFTGTDKQQTVPIIRFKQDGYAFNIVNTTKINFPQHCIVRRIQPLFILLYACCSVSINGITSVSWVWKTQNKQNQKQKVAANHYTYTSLLMFLFTGFPQNILFRVNGERWSFIKKKKKKKKWVLQAQPGPNYSLLRNTLVCNLYIENTQHAFAKIFSDFFFLN